MDFTKHVQKAEEAARRRNFDFAVELYQQLLELDPDHAEARAGLRRVLKKRFEQRKKGRLFRALSGVGPLAFARGLRRAGRHEAAIKAFESYLAQNPLDVEANLLLGRSLEDAGHFNSARVVYEFVAEIDPKNGEGLKRAGAMMQRAGEAQKALEYYERALEADPRDQEALKARKNLAAETALRTSRYEEVSHSREQIVDADQARRLDRAERRHKTPEELREELAELEERFAESSSDVDLMLRMADLHEKLGDPAAALDLVERARDWRRESFDLLDRHARLKAKVLKKELARADREGDTERGGRIERELLEFQVAATRERLALRPGDAALRVELARHQMRAGDLDGAVGELQRAVEDPRQRREALFLLGQCFQRKGFPDLARKEYEKALGESPVVDKLAKEILYNLGAIAEEQGDREQARAWYSRVFEVDIAYRDVAEKMEQLKAQG